MPAIAGVVRCRTGSRGCCRPFIKKRTRKATLVSDSKKAKFLCFDFETGGLDPDKHSIFTGFFAVLDQDLSIIDELDLKFKPEEGEDYVYEQQAIDVTGINPNSLKRDPESVTYSVGTEMLMRFISKWSAGGKKRIRPLGQNVSFDIGFAKKLVGADKWESKVHYRAADTSTAVTFLKDAGWFPSDIGGLASVARFLKVKSRKAHDAKEDVLMTIDVYKALLSFMNEKRHSSGSSIDLAAVLDRQ